MNLYATAAMAITLVVSTPVTAQDSASKQIAARTELDPIPSLTLSDQQFLTGDSNGKQVTVSGQLRIAQGSGRLPVVVMVHGSGGIGPNIDVWSKEFNEMGVSTFVLDGFTGRGLTAVSTNQAAGQPARWLTRSQTATPISPAKATAMPARSAASRGPSGTR